MIPTGKGLSMPDFGGVHHLNLTVTDLERSGDWFRSVLGLKQGWEMEDVQGRGRKLVLLHPTEPVRIVLTVHGSNPGEPFSEFRTGLDHVAFAVDDRGALEAWQRHFQALGVDHSPIKEGATGWLITFRDPDNIQYELYTRSK
jgi:glyoxylase I family protein